MKIIFSLTLLFHAFVLSAQKYDYSITEVNLGKTVVAQGGALDVDLSLNYTMHPDQNYQDLKVGFIISENNTLDLGQDSIFHVLTAAPDVYAGTNRANLHVAISAKKTPPGAYFFYGIKP